MSEPAPDQRVAHVHDCAAPFLRRGDPIGWFEAFYADQQGDESRVPWADASGHPLLAEWLGARPELAGARALVVGCGLGEEAEQVAGAGCAVTAFDVAPTAIQWARRRFPASRVDYSVADLFAPPAAWSRAFDLVVEIYTVQALPLELRERALDAVADFVAPAGRLLVITRGRDDGAETGDLPWPLSRTELARLERRGLRQRSFTDATDAEPPIRRFRVEYQRP